MLVLLCDPMMLFRPSSAIPVRYLGVTIRFRVSWFWECIRGLMPEIRTIQHQLPQNYSR